MTDASDPLLRLAALAGVAPGYRDAWGLSREVTPDTLRAVLAALKFAVATPSQIAESAAALEAEEWQPLLPPVAVVLEDDAAAAVFLTLPDARDDGSVAWNITCEDGTRRDGVIAIDGLAFLARHGARRRVALPLDPTLPLGYHQLQASVGGASGEMTLVVAPRRCHLPEAWEAGARDWGATAQLHGVRSARNWGFGDFTDLGALGDLLGRRGARALGLNPLHALFPAEPRHISPYSPSSRLFLNPLYIDVEAAPDYAECAEALAHAATPGFRARLASARAAALIDHPAVAALKQPLFETLFAHFAARHLGPGPGEARTSRGAAFRRFQHEGGTPLADFATFNALHEQVMRRSGTFSWRDWPAALREPGSAEVRRFAADHPGQIEMHQYLQWEADRQLGVGASRGGAAGLAVGLYRDLAVGVDPHGADAWAEPRMLASGASVGAPPDGLNLKGQDWGLAPLDPMALRRAAYAPFIAALRANMRHAGILRIDHVMALKNLYWVPHGAPPTAGAYVSYPFADLLRILALESRRQRCAVIGEDLGTVPDGFRETLAAAGVLSYRLLLFERDEGGGFRPPAAYPELATAAVATHDIATLKGFWLGRDLEWRDALDLYPNSEIREDDRRSRIADRHRLLAALLREGVLPAAAAPRLQPDGEAPFYAPELAEAVHRYLGRSPCRLVLLQLEDAVGEFEQANLPGTVDQHPNWRRKLDRALDELLDDPHFRRVTAALDEARAAPKGNA